MDPPLDISRLTFLLADPIRWQILTPLGAAEHPLPLIEIAYRINAHPKNFSHHIGHLRRAALVVCPITRGYALAPAYRPAPGSRDFPSATAPSTSRKPPEP